MAKTAIRLEHEWSDKPDYTSVKIVDPDGYVVEIAFDASLYGVIAYRVDRGEQVPNVPTESNRCDWPNKITGTFISDDRASFGGRRR